jgi:hypothetical protein
MNQKSAVITCSALLLLFATVAWLAVQTKGATCDEPYHALSAWVQSHYHDFRIDNEDPPLWQYWASLPNGKSALRADMNGVVWKSIPASVAQQWYWGVQTLYRTPGNDPDRFITRCRAMMLVLAVGLGLMICVWSWRVGGPVAAIVATALFSLDPNFLGHGPLMKNDVVFALSMFALAFALWKAGERLTVGRLAWVAVLCVVTLGEKFSGFIAVMLVPLLMGARALLPLAWPMPGKTGTTRAGRLLVAVGITAICLIVSYAGIWMMYGFRYRPTPQANVWLNLDELTGEVRYQAMLARYRGHPPAGMGPDKTLPLPAELAMFAHRHGLLPEAFIAGFLFTYANSLIRFAFANGQMSIVGWWWYFPFAILMKTPVATLLAMLVAVVAALRAWRGHRLQTPVWTTLCLLLPIALFLASAMASHLNIGLRHVTAIYPFIFTGVGVTAGRLWAAGRGRTHLAIAMIGLMLALETALSFPNYIAFFNGLATNASAGKIALLGDSNLDWGQDLPLLAQWQKAHPNEPMYLCYFGYADPRYYGIHYVPMPGGYRYDTTPHFPEEQPYTRCVVAISATNLQGYLFDPTLQSYYAKWARRKPIAVLGDSIFLYEFNPLSAGAAEH